ncbi:MAG: hypothetical protein AAF331_12390, partial [Pseudomonadota bacterium]
HAGNNNSKQCKNLEGSSESFVLLAPSDCELKDPKCGDADEYSQYVDKSMIKIDWIRDSNQIKTAPRASD